MLILAGTIVILVGICMVANGLYDKEKEKMQKEDPE